MCGYNAAQSALRRVDPHRGDTDSADVQSPAMSV